jgi:hypothetical protein
VNCYIEKIPVNSKAIRAVSYEGGMLGVTFHSGRIYDHHGVPEAVFHGLMTAAYLAQFATATFEDDISEDSGTAKTSPNHEQNHVAKANRG